MPKPPPVPEGQRRTTGVIRPIGGAERRYKALRRVARWIIGPVYDGEILPEREPCTIVFPDVVTGDIETFLAAVDREIHGTDLVGLPVLSFNYVGQTVDRRAFLVFPPVIGRTLSARVEVEGPLKPVAALQVAVVVADALTRLHARGRFLGELRPDAVLLPEDRSQPLRVVDLGIPRGLFTHCIAPPQPSEHFASPRVRGGAHPDARDDVFALGALLSFLLTGEPPGDLLPGRMRPLGPFANYLDGLVLAAMGATEAARGHQLPDMLQFARSLRGLRDLHRLSPQARRAVLSLLPEGRGSRPPRLPGAERSAQAESLGFVETHAGVDSPAVLSEQALQSIETHSIHTLAED